MINLLLKKYKTTLIIGLLGCLGLVIGLSYRNMHKSNTLGLQHTDETSLVITVHNSRLPQNATNNTSVATSDKVAQTILKDINQLKPVPEKDLAEGCRFEGVIYNLEFSQPSVSATMQQGGCEWITVGSRQLLISKTLSRDVQAAINKK